MKRKNKIIRDYVIYLLISLGGVSTLLSCSPKKSDTTFYIPEVGIHVTTSKRPGYMYMIFDTIPREMESDSVDYVKINIYEYSWIIFNKMHKDSIHFRADTQSEIHQVKFKFENLDMRPATSYHELSEYFENKFFNLDDKGRRHFKSEYVYLRINTRYYEICIDDKVVRKGNVTGGW